MDLSLVDKRHRKHGCTGQALLSGKLRRTISEIEAGKDDTIAILPAGVSRLLPAMYLLCTPHNLATSRRPRNRSMQCMQPRRCLLHSILPAAACPLVFNVPCRPRSSTLMRSATPPSTSRNTTGIRDGGVPAADATSRRAFDTTTRSLLCPASRMAGCLQCEIYCSWPSPPIGKPKGG
jgi:hypothetical protein